MLVTWTKGFFFSNQSNKSIKLSEIVVFRFFFPPKMIASLTV